VGYQASLFFLVLPLALAFGRARRGPRFPFEHWYSRREQVQASHLVVACLILLPASLLLLASGIVSGRIVFCFFSSLGALAGIYTLGGFYLLPLAALPLGGSWLLHGDLRLFCFDLAALLAAIGAGELLSDLLNGRELLFVGAIAAMDVIVVSLGLPQGAVNPASFGPLPSLAFNPPVYAGVAVDGVFLGAIDLACAVIVGSYLRRYRPATRLYDLSVYAVAQLTMIAVGLTFAIALPATLPPLVALLATRLPFAARAKLKQEAKQDAKDQSAEDSVAAPVAASSVATTSPAPTGASASSA
jgi:hypothetical protein